MIMLKKESFGHIPCDYFGQPMNFSANLRWKHHNTILYFSTSNSFSTSDELEKDFENEFFIDGSYESWLS